jgi:hypothetical protein
MIKSGKAIVNGRNRVLFRHPTSPTLYIKYSGNSKIKGGNPEKDPVSALESYLTQCKYSSANQKMIKIGDLFDGSLNDLLQHAHSYEELKMKADLVNCEFNIVNDHNQNIINAQHVQSTSSTYKLKALPQPKYKINYTYYSDDRYIEGYTQYFLINIPKYANSENISIAKKCSELTIKDFNSKFEEFKNKYTKKYKPVKIFETVPNSDTVKHACLFLNKYYIVKIEITEYDIKKHNEICFEFSMGMINNINKMYKLLTNFMNKDYTWKETYNDDLDKIMLQTFIQQRKELNSKADKITSLTDPMLIKHVFDYAKIPENIYNMTSLSRYMKQVIRKPVSNFH